MSCLQETAGSSADSDANVRTTLLMYADITGGVLDHARKPTE